MKQNKKILSLLMALVMCLSLLPSVAFAADPVSNDTSGLKTLLESANTGDTVKLEKDYSLTDMVVINKTITLDGNGHTITGASGKTALLVNASGVTVENLTVESSRFGINFWFSAPTAGKLTVKNTTIKNINVTDYDTTADYGADNRGLAAYNVVGGRVTVENCNILGFKYGINPVVDADGTGLRDGNGTVYDIKNSTVKGWAALNMWSANTTFSFTNCTLVGINTFNDGWNQYGTIVANSGIYGGNASKASTINFVGGSVTAKQYGKLGQANFMIDSEMLTKITFKYSGTLLNPSKVQINTDVIPGYVAAQFAFTGVSTAEQQQTYLNTKVSGMTSRNVDVNVGTLSASSAASIPMAVNDCDEFEIQSVAFDTVHTGGVK